MHQIYFYKLNIRFAKIPQMNTSHSRVRARHLHTDKKKHGIFTHE